MKKPKIPKCPTTAFGRELVAYLGGDPSPIQDNWCWQEFAKQYPELRESAEKFFEEAGTAEYAFLMVMECGSPKEWAEPIIEKAGDARYAFQMVCSFGSKKEWAEAIIEKAGDAWIACYMVRFCGSSKKWYNKIKRG